MQKKAQKIKMQKKYAKRQQKKYKKSVALKKGPKYLRVLLYILYIFIYYLCYYYNYCLTRILFKCFETQLFHSFFNISKFQIQYFIMRTIIINWV